MLRTDYSWTERALGVGATLMLTLLAVASLVMRYVIDPVTCFLPSEFTGAQGTYTLQTCQHATRLYTIMSDDTPVASDPELRPTYHQWLPFFLCVAALLCLLPHVTWRLFAPLLWMDVHTFLHAANANASRPANDRLAWIRDSAHVALSGLKGGNCGLTVASLVRKGAVCGVCLLQAVIMAAVFSPPLSISAQTDRWEGREEGDREAGGQDSLPGGEGGDEGEGGGGNVSFSLPLAPFLCGVSIRRMGRVESYTLQCFSPLARLYGTGLAFLFYAFLILFLASVLDLLVWLGRVWLPGLKDLALTRYLRLVLPNQPISQPPSHTLTQPAASQTQDQTKPSPTQVQISAFLNDLGLDGRLLVTLTSDHCGTLAAADLTCQLWHAYRTSPRSSPIYKGADPVGEGQGQGSGSAIPMVTISGGEADGSADGPGVSEKEKVFSGI